MEKLRSNLRRYRAFTLVELLIVIVVLAVLAAIVIPKFADSGSRSKDSSLKSDLQVVRSAVDLFKTDTGAYPAALTDLTAATASPPAAGKDATGATKAINASDYKGPYLPNVPADPTNSTTLAYSVAAGTVGKVTSANTGTDSSGIAYSTY